MTRQWSETVGRSYRAAVAHRHVTALSQYHRIQASPGFRAAAQYVAAQLEAAGVETCIRSYPADGLARFWSTPSFLEWECRAATLQLLDGAGLPVETLADFAAIPTSVIQRSVPAQGEFEVVALPGRDFDAVSVRGKLVLTGEAVGSLVTPLIRERGAAGIVFDGMRAGGRTELDLPDARQYTSFWWAGPQVPDAFGFVLTPRQGQKLRAQLGSGESVRMRAAIASRFYAGELEVVEAYLPGLAPDGGEEVLLVSHLCHPQPGAHDNGSGAAALIEAMATLARLYDSGELARPARGIRCIWPPEMTGTFAWLAEHEAEVQSGRWIAGLNLDMVGADQSLTGGSWQLVGLPQAAPAFADHLLAWLRQPYLDGQRHEETGFSVGSDHYILSDPTVGIPAPMLIQWPDRFYHTSDDTPDKVSPDSLRRSGALAAAYAYWLAGAGRDEAQWLGHWMVGRFKTAAITSAAAAAERLRGGADGQAAGVELQGYRDRSRFAAGRMAAALGTLTRLDPAMGPELRGLADEVWAAARGEVAWLEAVAGPAADGPMVVPAQPAWRQEAAMWLPVRRGPGPIDEGMAVQVCEPSLQARWQQLSREVGEPLREVGPLLQYWADGRRTVADIVEAVELETRRALTEDWPLQYFRLLEGMGLVEMRRTP